MMVKILQIKEVSTVDIKKKDGGDIDVEKSITNKVPNEISGSSGS
jgi:hypothetical protein